MPPNPEASQVPLIPLVIMLLVLAGAIVVGSALVVEVKYQPPFWLHAALWLPLILATTLLPLRSIKASQGTARDDLAPDNADRAGRCRRGAAGLSVSRNRNAGPMAWTGVKFVCLVCVAQMMARPSPPGKSVRPADHRRAIVPMHPVREFDMIGIMAALTAPGVLVEHLRAQRRGFVVEADDQDRGVRKQVIHQASPARFDSSATTSSTCTGLAATITRGPCHMTMQPREAVWFIEELSP